MRNKIAILFVALMIGSMLAFIAYDNQYTGEILIENNASKHVCLLIRGGEGIFSKQEGEQFDLYPGSRQKLVYTLGSKMTITTCEEPEKILLAYSTQNMTSYFTRYSLHLQYKTGKIERGAF